MACRVVLDGCLWLWNSVRRIFGFGVPSIKDADVPDVKVECGTVKVEESGKDVWLLSIAFEHLSKNGNAVNQSTQVSRNGIAAIQLRPSIGEETGEKSRSDLGIVPKILSNEDFSIHILYKEYIGLFNDPLDNINVSPANDNDYFAWRIAMFGEEDTVHEGGYYRMTLKFPSEYPFLPPRVTFDMDFYHPNVWPNDNSVYVPMLLDSALAGKLHLVKPDWLEEGAIFDEWNRLPFEQCWNPSLDARAVLKMVRKLLKTPMTGFAVNKEALDSYVRWRVGHGKRYEVRVRRVVNASRVIAKKLGVQLPARGPIDQEPLRYLETIVTI